MAETVKGLGIRAFVGGITMTAGIISATNSQKVQSIDFERTSDKGEIKDENGEVIGEIYHNHKKVLRLRVVPCALSGTNTIANGQSSLDAHLIAAGVKITIVDGEGTVLDGDYNLDSVKYAGSNSEGAPMVDLEMHKFDANDVTATIS